MKSFKELLAETIALQQPKVRNTVYYVGEQIKDICGDDEHLCKIVLDDLGVKEMSIQQAERKIAEYAKAHGGCTPPPEADRILREFYKLPAAGEKKREPAPVVDLLDFLG